MSRKEQAEVVAALMRWFQNQEVPSAYIPVILVQALCVALVFASENRSEAKKGAELASKILRKVVALAHG